MKNDLVEKIMALKSRRKAVILAHNYQRPEVQEIADFTGDSLGLSQRAAQTQAEVIVFCGVNFMAETAKLICPDRKVLVPDENAGCPMANMVTVRELREMKARHPDAVVICYVNSTAAVKAESDICCTSSNAVQVVASVPTDRKVLFIPDKSLGAWVAAQLKREIIFWDGYCPSHHRILAEHILQRKREHPNAKVVVHPECTADVIALADKVASTTGIARYCRESDAKEFIIGTEIGLLHRLQKESPGKTFIAATPLADCPNMKLNSLEKILWALEDMVYEVTVPEAVATRARRTIERMLELSN